MKKIQFKVEFNDEKLKAIKVSLKDKNKNLDEEILKFLNGLYNKNVPKLLKKYIEDDFEAENKTEEEVKEVQENLPNNGNKMSEKLDNNTNKY
ncbi:DUF6103 family protein [Clostridium algoriphilum]|uniref:DUF6103 family protein n=1 Tax=Clostridium algoriphilum TaxID=198347 RepID=UPI001CF5B900|nr:DUF6103 family protein [Clostridium algoriphilum]MCB2295451.1 DUF6103 family protein [Clostridium algoriphilum]